MTVILQNHSYRYALEQMCIIFFPRERYQFAINLPESAEYPLVISRISYDDKGNVKAETEIFLSDDKHFAAWAQEPSDESGKAAQSAIKMSFYRCAGKFIKLKLPWGILTGIRPSKIAMQLLEKGITEKEVSKILKNKYLVKASKRKLCIETAKAAMQIDRDTKANDFSLYISIPFCPSRCDYCSFVSHSIEKASNLIEPYIDALVSEIGQKGELSKRIGLNLKSVYIGGGTPTTLTQEQLDRVLSAISRDFDVGEKVEFTVEAGRPDTITAEKLLTLKRHKVNRISVNPQTLNDDVLFSIGRRHTVSDFYKAYKIAKDTGGFLINVDLIAGLPGDSVKSFKNTVKTICALKPDNITLHTLSQKVGSNFKRDSVKIFKNSKEAARMVDFCGKYLKRHKYSPYYLYKQKNTVGYLENTGFSKEGSECLYNVYMMEELHSVLSCGAGAVTKLVNRENGRIERMFNPKYPYEYISRQQETMKQIGKVTEFYERIDT